MRQSWETMTSVSAGHIILTPTTAGIEPRIASPGVARSTELLRPPAEGREKFNSVRMRMNKRMKLKVESSAEEGRGNAQ